MVDFDSPEYKVYLQDQKTDTPPAGLGHIYLPHLVELLPDFDYNNASILDIGAAQFSTYDWFLSEYKNKICGIDIGDYLVDILPSWSKTKRAHFLYPVDAHKALTAFPSGNFGLIISFHAFEHMFDLPLVLQNCNKLLKQNGHLYFALPCPSHNWHKGHWYEIPDIEAMGKMCIEAGFSMISSELIKDLRYRPEVEMVCLARKN